MEGNPQRIIQGNSLSRHMGKFLSKGKRSYIILRQLNCKKKKKKKREQSWSPTSIKNF